MKRTLYIHIGSHRTATTSVQRFLHRSFERLLQNGYLYPYRVARHFQLVNRLFDGDRTVDEVAQDFNKRADDKKAGIHSFIISDEDICMRPDLSLLAEFRTHFDVKIVYGLRRQDLWLESWYFQNVKWQWNPALSHCTFDEFLARRQEFHWIHYDRYVQHLEDLFGQENILLSCFEKEQQPDGPVNAFCRLVGLDALIGTDAVPHVNSSMSAAMVEFTRHLPMDEFKPPERELLRRALETVDQTSLGHSGKQSERMMPLEQRQATLAEYAAGNQALAERYFNRSALFLQPLPPQDAPLANLALPADSQQLVALYIAPLLRELVANGTIAAAPPKAK